MRVAAHQGPVSHDDSFPRRNAVTRRFSLGSARDFRVSRDGKRVAFLRSNGPEDPVNCLWLIDTATGDERVMADPGLFGANERAQPAEERARRERARESGEGIVVFDADADLLTACFAVGGQIGRVDLLSGAVERLETQTGAFDPRLSPDGSLVAYVANDSLRITGQGIDRELIGDESPTVSWGSAEFVACEEMGRTRGFWWSPDGAGLLVERVDVEPIDEWWIAAPVEPWRKPTAVRYPAAGRPNAKVDLALVALDGAVTPVAWNVGGWEYLAGVSWTADGLILTGQSRDQRTLAVLNVDPFSGAVSERYRITDEHWVELIPGVPRLVGERLVTVEDRGVARRVCVDGVSLTGSEWQVRRLVAADASGVVVVASRDPTTTDLVEVSWSGVTRVCSSGEGLHGAVSGGPTRVVVRRSLDPGSDETSIQTRDRVIEVTDLAERPALGLNVRIHRVGERRLAAALVQAVDHDGSPRPVLLDPYGGPHAQRVQAAAGLYYTSQWFADQGFAVVVIDGRGTPGRGPAFEREVRGDFAGIALDDQIAGLHALAEIEPTLDLSRVAIRGWSFGGYLAALAVLRRPDIFHAAVAGAPVTNWRLYDTHYTERYLGHPDEDPAAYDRNDLCAEPATMGDRVLPPLMLIHGLADDNVVAAHTLQLSRALMEAGKAHTVLPLSGVTHMTPQAEVAENLLLVQLAFIRDALGITTPSTGIAMAPVSGRER